jgi:hypothetical protein
MITMLYYVFRDKNIRAPVCSVSGPDADVDFAKQILQAHDWDLQAAATVVQGPGRGSAKHD